MRFLAMTALLGLLPRLADAGVVADGSRGSVVAHAGFDFGISGGTKVGGNLFHSFSNFDLVSGESATFSGPGDVTNILARVTGGSASSIDGTIRSTIAGANLFLMNPRGVVFGPNASLDVSGSFAVTTADYIKMSDGGRFNASLSGQDSLTSAPVSAFGFLSATPAAVTFNQSQLSVPPGMGLHIIAGDVALHGAALQAPSGSLTVFSAASAGEVPFDLASPGSNYSTTNFAALGTASLTGLSQMSIDGAGGGKVVIRGGKLTVDASSISSINVGSAPGGNISVHVDAELAVLNGGQINASTVGAGNGGNVTAKAGSLTIDPQGTNAQTGIFADSASSGVGGAAGDVTVTVSGHLTLQNGGEIDSSTFGLGQGGNINVTARDITIADATPDASFLSGILANSYGQGDSGQAGNVTVTALGQLDILGGGEISSQTFGLGNSGNLTVTAHDLTISGATQGNIPIDVSTIVTDSGSFGPGGQAGDITIMVMGQLKMLAGGQISSDTFGSGNGGKITVDANAIAISGFGSPLVSDSIAIAIPPLLQVSEAISPYVITGILAVSLGFDPSFAGNAGDIRVRTRDLSITNNGGISSSTLGLGGSGNIDIQSDRIYIARESVPYRTGIGTTSESFDPGIPSGPGGQLTIRAGDIIIRDGGEISALTHGLGNGGDITIIADSLSVTGGGASPATITATSLGTGQSGNAGDIAINARELSILAGGRISSETSGSGSGGNIMVQAASLSISGLASGEASAISTSAQQDSSGAAGNLNVQAGRITLFDHGQITASTHGSGHGGNATVGADALLVESGAAVSAQSFTDALAGSVQLTLGQLTLASGGAVLSANTGGGAAGSVLIRSRGDVSLSGASRISTDARAGNAGNIAIESGARITLEGHSTITASAGASGGNILLSARDLLFLDHSSIVATAGKGLVTGAQGGTAGAGGNISIDPTFIILDHAIISANAALGAGGNILLQAQYFFSSESLITATGSTAGTVTITAPELDLSGALVSLAAQFVDASTQLQERCTLRLGVEASSFLALGRGGVEDSPDEPQTEIAARARQKGKGKVRVR